MSKEDTSRIRRESVAPQAVSWEYETPVTARRRREDRPAVTSIPPLADVDADTLNDGPSASAIARGLPEVEATRTPPSIERAPVTRTPAPVRRRRQSPAWQRWLPYVVALWAGVAAAGLLAAAIFSGALVFG